MQFFTKQYFQSVSIVCVFFKESHLSRSWNPVDKSLHEVHDLSFHTFGDEEIQALMNPIINSEGQDYKFGKSAHLYTRASEIEITGVFMIDWPSIGTSEAGRYPNRGLAGVSTGLVIGKIYINNS